MKGSSKPEIYFLLSKGLKPKEIVNELGYRPTTVYYYTRRWKRGMEELVTRGVIDIDGRLKVKKK